RNSLGCIRWVAGYNFAMNKPILGRLLAIAWAMALSLSACGQKGELFIPTDPEAKDRAQFPKVLLPPAP
ncbi:MAG: hypothetical protein EBZ60_10265, partial [Betaproteobacteria bacterium]|nr:hypothetical protein [Betaproteobacteria bacterium]